MPQPRKSGSSARKPRPGAAAPSDASRGREDQLADALSALRDLLSRGVVIAAERLQETVDDAARRGRMTRQDAEELAQNLLAIGRRQTQDTLREVEQLARRAPGGDRVLRTVDRVRRSAGLGPAFPVLGYDELTGAQIVERLAELSPAQLRTVRDHERRHANRASVLEALERRLA
ncbi:MAG: hypothetical protein ACLGHP_07700 [Vicinamibacteria bacterium]